VLNKLLFSYFKFFEIKKTHYEVLLLGLYNKVEHDKQKKIEKKGNIGKIPMTTFLGSTKF